MDRELSDFLSAKRETSVKVGEQTLTLRLLSARETLELMEEIGNINENGERTAVYSNAALAARCLLIGGEPAFADADEVLDTLTAEETAAIAESFSELSRRFDPSARGSRARIESLKKASGTPTTSGSSGAC